jgi:hypothetical protein
VNDGNHARVYAQGVHNASGWYREILSDAEYPLATKRLFRLDALSDQERSSIYQRDWNQYVAWLGRDAVAEFG